MSHPMILMQQARIARNSLRVPRSTFSSSARAHNEPQTEASTESPAAPPVEPPAASSSKRVLSGPEARGLFPRSRYTAEQYSEQSGRPVPPPSKPTARSRSRSRAAHLPGGRLPARDLRTLVQLHHLAGTFIRPDQLDAAVDAAIEFTSSAPVYDSHLSSEERLRGIAADRLRRADAAGGSASGPALIMHASSPDAVGAISRPDSVTGSAADPPKYATRASKIPQALAAAREANHAADLGAGGLGAGGLGLGGGSALALLAEKGMTAREMAVREALYGVVKFSEDERAEPGVEAVEEYVREHEGKGLLADTEAEAAQ